MLRRLKHWLGWDSDSGPFDLECLEDPLHRPSSTAAVLGKHPPKQPVPPQRPVQRKALPKGAPKPPAKAKHQAPPARRSPTDVLHNPELSLTSPTEDGFDPYNTGAFNRSASWDQISKQRTR